MSESTTAEIIQFPTRQVAAVSADLPAPADVCPSSSNGALATAVADPAAPEARLNRALIGLNEALVVQRAAVAAWRASLGDLTEVTGRLGASLRGYHDNLGGLDARVANLRGEAVKLEAWADGVLSPEG